jgi:phosphoenolpyruvate phosphomutase
MRMQKAKKLRRMFRENDLIRVVGAHNGMTAKLVESHGFDAVWSSGLEVSTSYGVPDANILTMTEYLNAASSMNDVINIPVIMDADTGYGNSNNVIYLVRKLEAADIAAMCIEDKLFPKVNSYIPGRQELAPISEFVGKIMAAKNEQKSEDFMVFARVEAFIAGWGLEEAIKRANAYIDAGADAILIHSKENTPTEIEEFVKQWKNRAPLVIVPTSYPTITEERIKKIGIKMVIYANPGIRSAIRSIDDTLTVLRKSGTLSSVVDDIAPMTFVFQLQEMEQLKEYEMRFLRGGKENIIAVIPAAGDDSQQPSLSNILKDIPLTMLDINGKPLLQRNIEILNSLGIQDITVVGGYNGHKITVNGVTLILNKNYQNTHIMHSTMLVEERLKQKTLILFSDILFERDIIEKLINLDEDIVLVIDKSYKETSYPKEKRLDLVIAEFEPLKGTRAIHPDRKNRILKIGKNIPLEEANYEFVGIAMFSTKGIEILKNEYHELSKQKERKFHEAESFEMLSFTDMIQILINKKYPVYSLEIYKGWTEIRSFADYKNACKMLSYWAEGGVIG